MHFDKKALLIGFAILILLWNGYLYLQADKATDLNYLYNLGYALLYLGGAVLGVIAAIKTSLKSTLGKTLLFIGLGEGAYATGLLVWVYYNLVAKVEVPYPSTADVFFISFIPLIAIGCILLLRIVNTSLTTGHIIESLGIFVVSLVVVAGFISRPDLSSGLPLLTKVINSLYPLGDSILLALAYLVFRVAGGKIQQGILFLVIGLFFQVAGDMMFSIRTAEGNYWNGGIADTFFTLSAFTITYSVILIYDKFIAPQE